MISYIDSNPIFQKTSNDRIICNNILKIKTLGEVSNTGNGRLVFPQSRLKELSASLKSGWDYNEEPLYLLFLDKIDSLSKELAIDPNILPSVFLIEGECRIRTITGITLENEIDNIYQKVSTKEFFTLKEQASDLSQKILPHVRILTANDFSSKYKILSFMRRINDKQPYTLFDLANLISALIIDRELLLNIAYRIISAKSFKNEIKRICNEEGLDYSQAMKASNFIGISKDLVDAILNEELPIDVAFDIARAGYYAATQAAMANRPVPQVELARTIHEKEWIAKINKDPSKYIELRSYIGRYIDRRLIAQQQTKENENVKRAEEAAKKNIQRQSDRLKAAESIGADEEFIKGKIQAPPIEYRAKIVVDANTSFELVSNQSIFASINGMEVPFGFLKELIKND